MFDAKGEIRSKNFLTFVLNVMREYTTQILKLQM